MPVKKIVITIGDPAGCGPLITLKSLAALRRPDVEFFVVSSNKILSKYPIYKKIKNSFNFIDIETTGIDTVRPGQGSISTGIAALSYLDAALSLMDKLEIKLLVTAPLSKEAAGLVRKGFCGHTEYLAQYYRVKKYAMFMVSPNIKIVLLTRHIPLKSVSKAISPVLVKETLEVVLSGLTKIYRIKKPVIAFASCNPHAGINTFLGDEEKNIIKGIGKFKENVFGPFPSDTIFSPASIKKYDCIICPYHDQGMVAFKLLAFKDGVNLTAGLPIIRTSPVHGTAYDLMSSGGVPDHSSMLAAINLALRLKI